MLDGENSTVWLVSSALQVLAVVIVGIVVGALVTTFSDRFESAQLLASTAAALATVLLAGLTGYYASTAQENLQRAKREQRRPYIKRIVAMGIDRILEWLADSSSAWDVSDPPEGMPVYPELEAVGVSDDIVADIARGYPDLVRTVSEYLTVHREYRDTWERLHADLTRHIQGDFAFEELYGDREGTDAALYTDGGEPVDDEDDEVTTSLFSDPETDGGDADSDPGGDESSDGGLGDETGEEADAPVDTEDRTAGTGEGIVEAAEGGTSSEADPVDRDGDGPGGDKTEGDATGAEDDGPVAVADLVPERHAGLAFAGEASPETDAAAFVADHAETFARLVLTNPPVEVDGTTRVDDGTLATLLFDAYRREFLELRGEDPVADRIDVLDRHLQDLEDGEEDVREMLEDARSDYVEEYDIMETELGEVKDDGRLIV